MSPPIVQQSSREPDLDACWETDAHPYLNQSAPYESHLVCEFFRQIGGLEVALEYELKLKAEARKLLAAVMSSGSKAVNELEALFKEAKEPLYGCRAILAGNAQNPLDHLIGDVIGQTDYSRYFIIEFKRYAHGFADEVRNSKPDRVALFDHLLLDDSCKELSLLGHFGAYFDQGRIVFGTYFDLTSRGGGANDQLPTFFQKMREPSFAWSRDELFAYIDCMTNHGIELATDDGLIVFGYFDEFGQFVAMTSSTRVFAMIREALKRIRAMQESQSRTQQSTRASKPGGG